MLGDRLEISRTDAASAGPGPAKLIHVIPKPASARQDVGLHTHAASLDPPLWDLCTGRYGLPLDLLASR